MKMRMCRAAGCALAAGVVVGVALVWPGVAWSDRGEVVEYAELTIRGRDGIFVTGSQVIYLEGDEDRMDVERAENEPTIRVTRPPRLFHLNAVGREGWEVVDVFSVGGGETFLLQRGAFQGRR